PRPRLLPSFPTRRSSDLVRRVVFSSSCAVYGHPSITPIPEDAPLAPVNPYGETKRDFERMLADYARADGASVVNLRYFNAAGATDRKSTRLNSSHVAISY